MTESTLPAGDTREHTRARLVRVAGALLAEQGAAAVTTRGVAHAAGVQVPAIYRLFGDKDGLLEAVAEQAMDLYVTSKSAADAETALDRGADPVADLRAGWDTHVGFGLANPVLFRLSTNPDRAAGSPAHAAGMALLRSRVHRVAAAGRLRVGEQRAAELLHGAGTGAVLTLLAQPADQRDPGLTGAMWGAIARAILTGADDDIAASGGAARRGSSVAAAVGLRAVLPDLAGLSPAEQTLMEEWLDRAVTATRDPAPRDD